MQIRAAPGPEAWIWAEGDQLDGNREHLHQFGAATDGRRILQPKDCGHRNCISDPESLAHTSLDRIQVLAQVRGLETSALFPEEEKAAPIEIQTAASAKYISENTGIP